MTESDRKWPKENESDKKYRKLPHIVKNYQKLLKIIKKYQTFPQIAEIWTYMKRKINPGFDPDPGSEKSFPGSGSRINGDPGINPGIPQGPAHHGSKKTPDFHNTILHHQI